MPDINAALHAVKGETDATIKPILEKLTQRGFKSNDDAAGAFLGISVGVMHSYGLHHHYSHRYMHH